MSFFKWLPAVIVVLVAVVGCSGRAGLFAGTPPTDLGVHAGRLKPPSKTDNSVGSQAALYPDHLASAEIAPFPLDGDGPTTIARLKTVLEHMDGTTIVRADRDYLYAECKTPLLRFVDDVEFWYDPAQHVVQVRSASRLGSSDLGTNRKRVETIRAAFTAPH